MDEPLEETYFNWLYSKIGHVYNPTPSTSYYVLLRQLHKTEFVWQISGDDNRAADGLQLRHEFFHFLHRDFDEESPWFNIGCSVLEMLIAFARRAEFQTSIPVREWFWTFLENLSLNELCDANAEGAEDYIREVLDVFIWRTYGPNGEGGLFPLLETENDQRKVEVWYQFCEYLVNQDLV